LQKVKHNTLQGVPREQALKLLHSFFSFYCRPVSTYRLTKDFKRHRNVNVSDTKILELCEELQKRGLLLLHKSGDARYWCLQR
jgi:hypothetical protein